MFSEILYYLLNIWFLWLILLFQSLKFNSFHFRKIICNTIYVFQSLKFFYRSDCSVFLYFLKCFDCYTICFIDSNTPPCITGYGFSKFIIIFFQFLNCFILRHIYSSNIISTNSPTKSTHASFTLSR